MVLDVIASDWFFHLCWITILLCLLPAMIHQVRTPPVVSEAEAIVARAAYMKAKEARKRAH